MLDFSLGDFLFVFNSFQPVILLKHDEVIQILKAQVSWLLAGTLKQGHA